MVLLGLMQQNTEREQPLYPAHITVDVSNVVVFLAAERQYA